MLVALHEPSHPRHAEIMQRLGHEFDPTGVDRARLEKALAELAKLLAPRRRGPRKPRAATMRSKAKGNDWF